MNDHSNRVFRSNESDLNAHTITRSIGGKLFGSYGVAPCPVCQPEGRRDQTALTLKDGNQRLLMTCRKAGCSFVDVLAVLGVSEREYQSPSFEEIIRRKKAEDAQIKRKAAQARSIWSEAVPISGTIAETYLRNRGITCPMPDTLRFHGELWHGPTASHHPAMVAAVSRQGCVSDPAIHRTYLKTDGSEKAALNPAKMMLGSCSGGAVCVARGLAKIVVAEGIETALSIASMPGAADATVLAALSAPGMQRVALSPSGPDHLIIATDGDEVGRNAGASLALEAQMMGWRIEMLPAPASKDWNDVVKEGGDLWL